MREPLLMAAAGKKGVGKSYAHMMLMNGYVQGDPYNGVKGRKCVIMDVNDEYGVYNVPSISLNDVALFSIHPYVEMRRIRPFFPNGKRMTLDEWANALFFVLNRFQNGLLLIEDLNKFITDHLPQDLIGAIATNRHAGLDILLSFQSIGRINTKIWGNMNMLRFHKNIESVEKHKNKFPDKYEILSIAESIVNDQYNGGNSRYYLYVDLDEMKIRGEVTDEMIEKALTEYIYKNLNDLTKALTSQVEKGKKKYTTETAVAEVKNRLNLLYFK